MTEDLDGQTLLSNTAPTQSSRPATPSATAEAAGAAAADEPNPSEPRATADAKERT